MKTSALLPWVLVSVCLATPAPADSSTLNVKLYSDTKCKAKNPYTVPQGQEGELCNPFPVPNNLFEDTTYSAGSMEISNIPEGYTLELHSASECQWDDKETLIGSYTQPKKGDTKCVAVPNNGFKHKGTTVDVAGFLYKQN